MRATEGALWHAFAFVTPDTTAPCNKAVQEIAMRNQTLIATAMAAILAAASSWCAAGEGGSTPVTVQVHGKSITVVSDHAPLKDILGQLQQQSGFELVEGSASLLRPVTVDLDHVPWQEGMAELLHGFRYALAMDPETGRPAKLVLLSSDGSANEDEATASAPDTARAADGSSDANQPMSSMEEATRIANELMAQSENPLQHAMRKAREAATGAEGAQASPEAGEDAQGREARYADSLRALGQFPDPERLDVLAPALGAKSRTVRSAALEALRDGTVRDESVLGSVRGMATGDSDPIVQRQALEVYVRYADRSEVLALVQSMGRTSGPARDIAVREWMRIEKEIADAPLADQQLKSARR